MYWIETQKLNFGMAVAVTCNACKQTCIVDGWQVKLVNVNVEEYTHNVGIKQLLRGRGHHVSCSRFLCHLTNEPRIITLRGLRMIECMLTKDALKLLYSVHWNTIHIPYHDLSNIHFNSLKIPLLAHLTCIYFAVLSIYSGVHHQQLTRQEPHETLALISSA